MKFTNLKILNDINSQGSFVTNSKQSQLDKTATSLTIKNFTLPESLTQINEEKDHHV